MAINNIVQLVESIFRVRDNRGNLVDYNMTEPHKQLLRTGIVGDSSTRFRIINKGRQIGFSIFMAIECLLIAKLYPYTNQFYIATKEAKAKEWLEKVERIAKDSRVMIDSSRIIDLDDKRSSLVRKAFKHIPRDVRKEIGYSYIAGLAASPREVGMTGINLILDEYDHMNKERDLQKKIWVALKPVLSQAGSQCSILSTPLTKSDVFWDLYINAERRGFKSYYFPVIENWKEIDLSIPLMEQYEKLVIPYDWIDLGELERERLDDITYFKQERLGIPADVAHRYITPELLEASAHSKMMRIPQGRPMLKCAIDVASTVDVTAVTISQILDGINYERNLYSTSGEFPQQEIDVLKFLAPYKPYLTYYGVRIDNTGIGKALADYLKRGGHNIRRINFQSTIETKTPDVIDQHNKKKKTTIKIGTFMAEQFKRSLEDGTYLTLDPDESCQYIRQATNHTLNVEQQMTTTTKEIRYSGKRNGRDDFFWSRSMINADFKKLEQSPRFNVASSNPMTTMKKKILVSNCIRRNNVINMKKRRYAGW